MFVRVVGIGLIVSVLGCGAKPERSRVVTPTEADRNPSGGHTEPGARESYKIEMH